MTRVTHDTGIECHPASSDARPRRVRRYRACVQLLLRHVPGIERSLAEQGDRFSLDGWQSMQLRFQAFQQQDAGR
jgi:hypothetical protein